MRIANNLKIEVVQSSGMLLTWKIMAYLSAILFVLLIILSVKVDSEKSYIVKEHAIILDQLWYTSTFFFVTIRVAGNRDNFPAFHPPT